MKRPVPAGEVASSSHGDASRRGSSILWLGGSSGLTRTYVNEFGTSGLVLCGMEEATPAWMEDARQKFPSSDPVFVSCDLTKLSNVEEAKEVLVRVVSNCFPIDTIIIGVRPPLLTAQNQTDRPQKLRKGIRNFLQAAVDILGESLKTVLHISSVAAVDHLRAQCFVKENDHDYKSSQLDHLQAPYDQFKRGCEIDIDRVLEESRGIYLMHLRLSAIFSDDPSCIQCTSMELQRIMGCYVSKAIDCNSSRNVARAIHSILLRLRRAAKNKANESFPRVIYYTRPLNMPRPVPYGDYLKIYRQAYILSFPKSWSGRLMMWVPSFIHVVLVFLVRCLAQVNQSILKNRIPYIDSIDYLLQVSSREHSFDCSLFAKYFAFDEEETILQCFVRRNQLLHGTRARRN